MSPTPVVFQFPAEPRLRAGLRETLSEHESLRQVAEWCAHQDPHTEPLSLMQLDEFTLDVIFRHDDLWLVYDST